MEAALAVWWPTNDCSRESVSAYLAATSGLYAVDHGPKHACKPYRGPFQSTPVARAKKSLALAQGARIVVTDPEIISGRLCGACALPLLRTPQITVSQSFKVDFRQVVNF